MKPLRNSSGTPISSELVNQQLDRLVRSAVFSKSARLTAFLRFIVGETLSGHGEGLNEHVIAIELYQRSGPDFDSSSDPIVRVDARRLRDKLREYYAECPDDPLFISLPKGSYMPLFAQAAIPRNKLSRVWIATAAIVVLGLLAYALSRQSPQVAVLRPVFALPGQKGAPSLDADGRRIAFSWSGNVYKPARGIYVQDLGEPEPRKLTTGGFDPAWSPDGREIAFDRLGPNRGLYVIAVDGGSERKIIDSGSEPHWSPDQQFLFYRELDPANGRGGIFSASVRTGERRRLTTAPAGIGDQSVAVSPDGRSLAFVRFTTPLAGDVYRVPASGGDARRLTDWNGSIGGIAWTPDGRDVFTVQVSPQVSGSGEFPRWCACRAKGARLNVSTGDASSPSISGKFIGRFFRLAYVAEHYSHSIFLADLRSGDHVPKPFQQSSRRDSYGQFSSDDGEMAFVSDRDGTPEIWTAGLNNSSLRRITSSNVQAVTFPSWSPDGHNIAFTGSPGRARRKCLFIVAASGGGSRQLTDEATIGPPSWSRDGRWIYFMSDRSGSNQIWKVSATGEGLAQLTHDGGFEVQESVDGKYLYYTDQAPDVGRLPSSCRLMRTAVGSGEATVILPVMAFHWSVAESGIYYSSRDTVMLYHLEDKRSEPIYPLPENLRMTTDLRVSRDGRWLLAGRAQQDTAELMLIDKLR